jgi:hypothetical protein
LSPDIDETIIQIMDEHESLTVQQLMNLLKDRLQLTETEIDENLNRLNHEGRIKLEKQPVFSHSIPYSKSYISTASAYWFFLIVALTLGTTIAVFGISEYAPESIIRYALGFIYVLVLPGYSLMRILFPCKRFGSKENMLIDWLTRFSFSVVFSIAIVSMVGLALDYVWAVNLDSLILSLSSLTFFFAIVAFVRENRRYNEAVRVQ